LEQELSSLRQFEKDVKKWLFEKGQEYTDLDSRVLPLRTRVLEMEEEEEAPRPRWPNLRNGPPIKRCSLAGWRVN